MSALVLRLLRWIVTLGVVGALSTSTAFASQATFNAAGDTAINSTQAANNVGSSIAMFTGRHGGNGFTRGLVKFNVSGLAGAAVVTSVQLFMTNGGIGSTLAGTPIAGTVSIHPRTENWTEGTGVTDVVGPAPGGWMTGQACTAVGNGATWNSPTCTGGGWGGLAGASASVAVPNTANNRLTWGSTAAMVSDVQSWINGTTGSWMLVSSTEFTPNGTGGFLTGQVQRFVTTNDVGNSANWPVLVVNYTTCTGARNSACVTSQSSNVCNDNGGTNAPTTYSCTCNNAAYAQGPSNQSCIDKDECVNNPCDDNGDTAATCTDHVAPTAGHTCACSTGFNFNGTSCVGNCPPSTPASDPCRTGGDAGGACSSTGAGTWSCSCTTANGYVTNGATRSNCVNFNACNAAAKTACADTSAGNSCVDEAPNSITYHCSCGHAAYVIAADMKSCVNKNECVTNHCIDGGDAGGTCLDRPAPSTGYDCSCTNSFWTLGNVGANLSCVDRNECNGTNPCVNGTCTNITAGGGYSCDCEPGFLSTGGGAPVCEHPDGCNANAAVSCATDQAGNSCVNNAPPAIGFHCDCGNPGYIVSNDLRSCANKNECAINRCSDGGDRGATCIDARPPRAGFECECSTGWRFDGATCVDIDECGGGSNPCGEGNCSNLKGGYQCNCGGGLKSTGGATPTCVSSSAGRYVVTTTAGGCSAAPNARFDWVMAALIAFALVFLRRRRANPREKLSSRVIQP
jgi:hypothetical protein